MYPFASNNNRKTHTTSSRNREKSTLNDSIGKIRFFPKKKKTFWKTRVIVFFAQKNGGKKEIGVPKSH